MKKGTILKNSMSSESNALKYSIYLGTCGDSVNVLFSTVDISKRHGITKET